MCSSDFGPAIVPSLVMCPMRKIGIESRFAAVIRIPAESRTCAMEPGAVSLVDVCTVWIESTTIATGFIFSASATMRSTDVSAKSRMFWCVVPRRRARRAICRGDSSPDAYSTVPRWERCSAA